MTTSFLLLFIVLIIVVYMVYGTLRRDPSDRVKEPSCAVCRYHVRGLQSFICPECGTDVREGGILTPNLRVVRCPSLVLLWASWTAAIVVVGLILTAIGSAIPGVQRQTATRSVVVTSPSGLFGQASIASSARKNLTRFDSKRVELIASPAASGTWDRSHSLVVRDGPSVSWTTISALGERKRTDAALERSDVVAWIESAGVKVDSPQKNAEVDELFGTVRDMLANPDATGVAYSRLVPRSSVGGISTGSSEWYLIGTGSFWFIVWIVGLYLIRRGHRAGSRRASVPNRASAQSA